MFAECVDAHVGGLHTPQAAHTAVTQWLAEPWAPLRATSSDDDEGAPDWWDGDSQLADAAALLSRVPGGG